MGLVANAVRNGVRADFYMPGGFNLANPADTWMNTACKAAITKGKPLILPNYPVKLAADLKLTGNIDYYMPPGGCLVRIPSTVASYKICLIDNCQSNNLINIRTRGDSDSTIRASMGAGEYGNGFNVVRSDNVTLWNPICEYPFGDGIYLRGTGENITIINPYIDYANRNGISIVSGKNTIIKGGLIKRSVNNPAAGIDIEPNPDGEIFNVTVIGLRTEASQWAAHQVGLGKLFQTPGDKTIGSIKFIDCVDFGSKWGFWLSFLQGGYPPSAKNPNFPVVPVHISGSIEIINYRLKGVREEYIHNAYSASEAQISLKFINPIWEDKSGSGRLLTSSELATETNKIGVKTPRPILLLT